MIPSEIKQVLSSAQIELKNCYNQLAEKNNKVLSIVDKYCKALPQSLIMGGNFCKKRNPDNSGACFIQCDECKAKNVEQNILLQKKTPAPRVSFFL